MEFKGFDIVIKVFKALNEEFPNQIALLLIGGIDPIHSTGLNMYESFNQTFIYAQPQTIISVHTKQKALI